MMEKYGVKDLDMTPLPNVVVRLPQVVYFWKALDGSQELQDALALGLHIAITYGSLNTLIRTFPHISDAYAYITTNDFFVIDIANHELPGDATRQ